MVSPLLILLAGVSACGCPIAAASRPVEDKSNIARATIPLGDHTFSIGMELAREDDAGTGAGGIDGPMTRPWFPALMRAA
jgi:hypothetical protein